jgi:EmrB/QacA subfamily drug resistance transporter
MAIHNPRSTANPWVVLAILVLGLFMTLLDLTIVNIAIPSITDDLHASLDHILWVLNAYSLVYAVLLITAGRLGDIFGPRNLFALGVVIFTVASALSGVAHDPTQLILARAAQGLGAAVIAPQGLPIMTTIFPPERRAGVFAIYGALAGLAVVAGPTLGGFLVTHFGWRWIFYVNLPVGVVTLALALLIVPDLRPGRPHRLDLSGVLLATAGLLGVVFGLIEGQRFDWGRVWGVITIPEIIGAGVLVLLVFLVTQARRQDREPLLPFAVFKDRNYTLMTLVLAAMGFAMVGFFLPLTIYFQSVLGLSALDAGLTTAAMPLTMMFVSPVVAGLVNRFNPKYILMVGLTLFAAGMAYIALNAHADSGRWSFLPGLMLGGAGMGCTWTPVFSLATRDLQPRLAGVASGVLNTIQELGSVIAGAAIGAVLQNRLAVALPQQAVQYAAQLPPEFRDRFVEGFRGAARSGLEVGRGQTGASLHLPPGVPTQVVEQLHHLAGEVFRHAFADTMAAALVLPMAVVLLAALSCLAVRRRASATAAPLSAEEAASVA